MKKKDKCRFILDVDSTEDPAYGKQEGCVFNGHFGKSCLHPIVAFTGDGDCLAAELRLGNVHSADGILDFIKPLVARYRQRYKLFWFRGDAAFALPDIYEYCGKERVTYFIRLPTNETLRKMTEPEITKRPVCRTLNSALRSSTSNFTTGPEAGRSVAGWCARSRGTMMRFFPRVGFILTNSTLRARQVVRAYNGRATLEDPIKEAKNALRWYKTSCHRFEADQARLKMGALAYNLLQMIREFHLQGEDVKRSMEWLIRRIIKAVSRISYSGRR